MRAFLANGSGVVFVVLLVVLVSLVSGIGRKLLFRGLVAVTKAISRPAGRGIRRGIRWAATTLLAFLVGGYSRVRAATVEEIRRRKVRAAARSESSS